MKKVSRKRLSRFQLEIHAYGNSYYLDRITELERELARKPRAIQLDMVGVGEIPADWSLLIRSVLMDRSPKIQLITNARSSLQGGSVLVWLLGDHRIIRTDARLFFRRTDLSEDAEAKPNEEWKDADLTFSDSDNDMDPEEGDYAQVLQLINEYLPVRELAGRLIGVPVLRQFGLVDNEEVDQLLAMAFGTSKKLLVAK